MLMALLLLLIALILLLAAFKGVGIPTLLKNIGSVNIRSTPTFGEDDEEESAPIG